MSFMLCNDGDGCVWFKCELHNICKFRGQKLHLTNIGHKYLSLEIFDWAWDNMQQVEVLQIL